MRISRVERKVNLRRFQKYIRPETPEAGFTFRPPGRKKPEDFCGRHVTCTLALGDELSASRPDSALGIHGSSIDCVHKEIVGILENCGTIFPTICSPHTLRPDKAAYAGGFFPTAYCTSSAALLCCCCLCFFKFWRVRVCCVFHFRSVRSTTPTSCRSSALVCMGVSVVRSSPVPAVGLLSGVVLDRTERPACTPAAPTVLP